MSAWDSEPNPIRKRKKRRGRKGGREKGKVYFEFQVFVQAWKWPWGVEPTRLVQGYLQLHGKSRPARAK